MHSPSLRNGQVDRDQSTRRIVATILDRESYVALARRECPVRPTSPLHPLPATASVPLLWYPSYDPGFRVSRAATGGWTPSPDPDSESISIRCTVGNPHPPPTPSRHALFQGGSSHSWIFQGTSPMEPWKEKKATAVAGTMFEVSTTIIPPWLFFCFCLAGHYCIQSTWFARNERWLTIWVYEMIFTEEGLVLIRTFSICCHDRSLHVHPLFLSVCLPFSYSLLRGSVNYLVSTMLPYEVMYWD